MKRNLKRFSYQICILFFVNMCLINFKRLVNSVIKMTKNGNVKNGILFAVFSFLNMGINFIITMILARYILPDSYGKLSLFFVIVSMFNIFICLGVNSYKSTQFFKLDKERIVRLINVTITVSLLVYILLLMFIVLFPSLFSNVLGLNSLYQFYALTYCLTHIFSMELLDIWRLEESVWRYGTFTVLSLVMNLLLTVLFVWEMRFDWEGRVYAMIVTGVLFAFIALYVLHRKGYLSLVKPTMQDYKRALTYGLPLIPHGTSFWLRQGLDRILINTYFSQATVGLFSLAANFSNVIQVIASAFNQSNSVYIYKKLSSLEMDQLPSFKKKCFLQVLFYVFLSLIIFIGAYFFLPLLFPKYIEARFYIFPLCMGSMFQCIYLVYVNILFFYGCTKQLMYITFSFSLLHSFLSIFMTKYDAFFTACIPVMVNSIVALSVYRYAMRLLERKVGKEN